MTVKSCSTLVGGCSKANGKHLSHGWSPNLKTRSLKDAKTGLKVIVNTHQSHNCLEGFNSSLKTYQTDFKIMGLGAFKDRLLEIVEERSEDYDNRVKAPPINEVPVTEQQIYEAYKYLLSNDVLHIEDENEIVNFYWATGNHVILLILLI